MDKTTDEWLSRVERAQRRADQTWLKEAREALRIYHGGKRSVIGTSNDVTPFNILYSNTEVLAPALFNSTPRADVGVRRQKSDILVKVGAQALHQYLDFQLDTNNAQNEAFGDAVSQAVLSALVPGLGQVRLREPFGERQHLSVESVPFDRFLWGWARRWQDVPWVAFGHDLTYADFKARYPKAAKDLKEDEEDGDWAPQTSTEGEESTKQPGQPGVLVWEIWDKATKKVFEVSDCVRDQQLGEKPWPLMFSASFPCPKPLTIVDRVATLTPTTLYSYYRTQAEELNTITRRLKSIVGAVKVRGIYNSAMREIEKVLDEDADNALIPAAGAQMLADNGGLEKHIWLMPIELLMKVAKELYAAREAIKSTIYEIMGIADILRGSSSPSETATAQNIKDRWGTLRLKKSQRLVQFFVRDLLRLLAEAAPQVVPEEAWAAVTDLNLPTPEEKAKAAMEMQLFQQSQMMAGTAGQPPAEPPPELLQILERPTWMEVLQFLQTPNARFYSIDVESNSTVDIEATEDKAAIAEFMNAMGQFLAGVAPLVEQGSMPFDAAKGMLLEIMRRFRFSKQVEEYLQAMQPPQPKANDPEIEKQKKEAEKAQAQAQSEMDKLKQFEDKIKEAMRSIKEERAMFETDKKVFTIEQQAQEKVRNAQEQVLTTKRQADQKIATTKMQSTADKLSMGLSSQKAEMDQSAKDVKQSEKDVKTTMSPVAEAMKILTQSQQQIAQILAQVSEAMASLQSNEDEREIAMMGTDGKVRTALVRKRKSTKEPLQ